MKNAIFCFLLVVVLTLVESRNHSGGREGLIRTTIHAVDELRPKKDFNKLVQQALHNGRSKCAGDVNQKQQSVEDTIKAVLLEDIRREIREANEQHHLRMSKERAHAARVARDAETLNNVHERTFAKTEDAGR
jgi:hypothetical protein